MDIGKQLLDEYEFKAIDDNNAIFDLVLKEILDTIEETFNFTNAETAGQKVIGLKNDFIYTSKYVDLFFEILTKYNYYMKTEIKDAIQKLGNLENPNNNQILIKKLIKSPMIQDISFNGSNEFTLMSEQYGTFNFELAKYHFRNNHKISNYLDTNVLPNRCHFHAYFLSEILKDLYATTSLCRSYFTGSYYHSYTYNQDENTIIDLCSNCIMDKDLYYYLYEPIDISIILNSKVEEELKITRNKTIQYFDRCKILKIALYRQYLTSIGYHGKLRNAPSKK